MRRALSQSLKSLAFAAIGGWLAVGPVGFSHGQGTGAAVGTGAQAGGTSVGAGTRAAAGASRQLPATGVGANLGNSAGANARAQAGTYTGARMQAEAINQARNLQGAAAGQNRRTAAGAQSQFDARSRANMARTRPQASSVDTDRANDSFDSRFNDRFDDGFDDRFDTRSERRTFDNRATDDRVFDNRPEPRGLTRAQRQLDANQQRFEDRRGFSNPGLDTARDRVLRNLDRFDERSDRSSDTIDRDARFDAEVGEDDFRTGMSDDRRLRDPNPIDRDVRVDTAVVEDDLGMVDDLRLREGSGIDRGMRFDSGIGGVESRTSMPADARLRDRRFDGFDVRAPAAPLDRGRMPPDVAAQRSRLDTSRPRFPAVPDGGMAPLSAAADPRLDAARRTIAAEGQVRSQQEFRDDLGVRRNMSSATRRAGYRGTSEAVDLERDRFERSTNPTPRVLGDRLDRSNDPPTRRAVGERIE